MIEVNEQSEDTKSNVEVKIVENKPEITVKSKREGNAEVKPKEKSEVKNVKETKA